jgi:sortase A
VAIIRIPKIGVDKAVVEGVGVPDLKKGPGHYPTSPMPGQPGNAAIAGHRTTYGAPFYRLDELHPGDEIRVTTRQGRFRFSVESTEIVKPSQTEVLDPPKDGLAHLTLTTCNPRYSARQRLVVHAVLEGEPAPPTVAPARADDERADAPVVAFEEPSLSGDRSAAAPTVLWALACLAVALATWFAARRWKRWVAYLVGGAVFLVVLFVCFENVSRLLPANI